MYCWTRSARRLTCLDCAAGCAANGISTITYDAPMNDVQVPVLDTAPPTGISADDALWYKDAVIYQVNVKSFLDSNADGIGDFKGLTSKLEYIRDLGVNTIWLMPFYPSPLKDDGYDIADYQNVHP